MYQFHRKLVGGNPVLQQTTKRPSCFVELGGQSQDLLVYSSVDITDTGEWSQA